MNERKYRHRYVVLHRFLMELDSDGKVIGRVVAAPLLELFENGHKDVYWDHRPGPEYDLQVGDRWIPPDGYFE